MTNKEKFIQIFGAVTWQQMIVFAGLDEQFSEYWALPYIKDTTSELQAEKARYNKGSREI